MTTTQAAQPARPRTVRKWDEAGDKIVSAYGRARDDGTPVYLRLKRTVADLIHVGALEVEAQLPPEQWLARALGVSLGTAQKALSALGSDGLIERRQGHGTYVAAPRRSMTELWHYRFFDPKTAAFAPIYSRLISRRIVAGKSLAPLLGTDPAGFVEIQREIDVAGEVRCHSRIFLGASHFAPLMEVEATVFDSVNLKSIFATRFGRPTVEATQHLHLAPPTAMAQKTIKRPKDELAMVLTVLASSHDGPFSYQEAYIPRSRFRLDMSLGGDAPALHPAIAAPPA